MSWRNRIVGYGTADPEQLLANPANFRIHPQAQQAALQGALNEIGWIDDVIVNRTTDTVVDGHLRIALALRQGEKEVPVKYVELSEDEEHLALLTLDPIAAMAAADREKLGALMRDVQTGEAGLQAMLAEMAEREGVYFGANGDGHEDAGPLTDKAAELQEKWQVKAGDVWEIPSRSTPGRAHRVMCGDSTDAESVARLMGGEKAALIFTSPPYGVGIEYGIYRDTLNNLREMLPLLARRWMDILNPGGFAVVNFGDIVSASDILGTQEPCEYPMALEYWPIFRDCGYVLWSRRIWKIGFCVQ